MPVSTPLSILAILALAAATGIVGLAAPAAAQSSTLAQPQSAALAAYDKALRAFKAILAERRQIDARETLPDRPGQALYLVRREVMSTYEDLTDAMPSRIGRPTS